MEWYYAIGTDRKGPVSEEEFQRLVAQGVIASGTLVWREGMANWQPHGGGTPPPVAGAAMTGDVVCAGCGSSFPSSEVVSVANASYCAACKPLALQRLKEGAATNAVEDIRKEHIKHEASVTSIGILYYLGGVAFTLVGIITFFSTGTPSSGGEAIILFFIFLLLGTCQLWVGYGLRRLRKWARIPTGILSGLGLLAFPIGTLINAYVLYLIFCQKGKMVFSDEYRAVIEQTPHIKYRTSIIVWIVLGLLLLLIAFAIFGAIVTRR